MYRGLLLACFLVAGCAIWSAVGEEMDHIHGVNCTQIDIATTGRCVMKFIHGHGSYVIAKMRQSSFCDPTLVDCSVVLETRLCLENIVAKELSARCRPFIDEVSNYYLGLLNIPCRVSHFRAICWDYFGERGYKGF